MSYFFRFESKDYYSNGVPKEDATILVTKPEAREAFEEALEYAKENRLRIVDMKKV